MNQKMFTNEGALVYVAACGCTYHPTTLKNVEKCGTHCMCGPLAIRRVLLTDIQARQKQREALRPRRGFAQASLMFG